MITAFFLAAAIDAALFWAWSATHRAALRKEYLAGRAELRHDVVSFLETYARARGLDGDQLTAGALRAAAAHVWHDMTAVPPDALRNETRCKTRENENGHGL